MGLNQHHLQCVNIHSVHGDRAEPPGSLLPTTPSNISQRLFPSPCPKLLLNLGGGSTGSRIPSAASPGLPWSRSGCAVNEVGPQQMGAAVMDGSSGCTAAPVLVFPKCFGAVCNHRKSVSFFSINAPQVQSQLHLPTLPQAEQHRKKLREL